MAQVPESTQDFEKYWPATAVFKEINPARVIFEKNHSQ
jgi:hypothetical protein